MSHACILNFLSSRKRGAGTEVSSVFASVQRAAFSLNVSPCDIPCEDFHVPPRAYCVDLGRAFMCRREMHTFLRAWLSWGLRRWHCYPFLLLSFCRSPSILCVPSPVSFLLVFPRDLSLSRVLLSGTGPCFLSVSFLLYSTGFLLPVLVSFSPSVNFPTTDGFGVNSVFWSHPACSLTPQQSASNPL